MLLVLLIVYGTLDGWLILQKCGLAETAWIRIRMPESDGKCYATCFDDTGDFLYRLDKANTVEELKEKLGKKYEYSNAEPSEVEKGAKVLKIHQQHLCIINESLAQNRINAVFLRLLNHVRIIPNAQKCIKKQ